MAFIFGYARELYGEAGAVVALAVAALCPNLLAHGALVTPDIYLAAATVGFLWSIECLARRPSAAAAVTLGICLGFSVAVKFTGILYVLLAPLLLRLAKPVAPRRVFLRWLPAALLLAFLFIHAAYVFDGSFSRLGEFSFSSSLYQWLQAHLPGGFPTFFPRHFVRALDEQLAERPYLAYLAGEFNRGGFLSYYAVAFFLRTPIAPLLLGGLATASQLRPARKELPLLAFALVLFVFFSLARHKNIGLRYLLFLFPLLAVWCGRLSSVSGTIAGRIPRRGLAAGLWLLLLASNLLAWPDYLAFFNSAAGGKEGGHRYLLDSNLDWGQGLIELRDFLKEERIDKISLAYAGRVNPEFYGIRYDDLGGEPPTQDVVAISANLLWGRMYFVNGKKFWPKSTETYALYRSLEPWAILGGSIYVYRRPR